MKKVRTIRIDRQVSDDLDFICERHGDVSWHIEQALKGYKPISQLSTQIKAEPTEPRGISSTPIKDGWVEAEQLFDDFWHSGIRKVNKKKAKALFSNLLKKPRELSKLDFTYRLIQDIKTRLASNQLGFAEMHPTTYLNGERWNDEVTPNAQNQLGRPTATSRLTPAQRTKAAGERWEAEQKDNVPTMGGNAGDLRSSVQQPIRGGADGFVGTTIDGDYTTTD